MQDNKERTLVLLKPDAVQRGLIGAILSRFEQVGLNIVACRMLVLDDELASKHYAVHEGKPFYEKLKAYITSGPVMALALEGDGAIELVRKIIGPTDGRKAPPGTVRGDFGRDLTMNLVHASDSPETAPYELRLFFKEDEYISWSFDTERWMHHPEG